MAYARPEMLVGGAWLEIHLDDLNLRVVDGDTPEQYLRAQIRDAVNFGGDHYYKDPDDRRFLMRRTSSRRRWRSWVSATIRR